MRFFHETRRMRFSETQQHLKVRSGPMKPVVALALAAAAVVGPLGAPYRVLIGTG